MNLPNASASPGAAEEDVPRLASGRRALLPALRELGTRRMALVAMAAMSLLYFWSYFQRVAVPGTVFDELQSDLKMSAKAVTGLAATYLYIYAAMQIFVGLLADRFGGARVMLIGGAFLSLGAILFPLAGKVHLLFASRALVGLGASVMYLCALKELDALFGTRGFSLLIGPLQFVGLLGGVMGTLPFERAVHAFGWRAALLGVGVLTALTLGGVFLLLRRGQHPASGDRTFSWRTLGPVLRNPRVIPVLIANPIQFALYFLIQAAVGKKFLQDCAGATSAQAAAVTFGMMLLAMALMFSTGLVLHAFRERRKPVLILALALATLALLALVVATRRGPAPAPWTVLPCLLLGLSAGLGPPVFTCVIRELCPSKAVATVVGVLNAIVYVAVAAIANLAGAVLDRFQDRALVTPTATVYPAEAYSSLFGWSAALALVGLVAVCFIRETGRNVVE